MAIEIFMPALSPTMEEGTLAKWLVKAGDSVETGDIIAEIETDKATMEVEAVDEGTVAQILVEAGAENVKVGTLIALMAEEGEDIASVTADAPRASTTAVEQEAPMPAQSEPEAPKAEAPKPEKTPGPVSLPSSGPAASLSTGGDRIKASPLAKRLAGQKGIDLKGVTGSGPYGRIIKRDIEGIEAGSIPAAPAIPARAAGITAPRQETAYAGRHADIPFREVKLSGMRKTIARRLTESKTTVPHFYLTVDCDMTNLMDHRKALNARLEKSGVKLSVNDFIIKSVAMALKKVPAANVQFAGDKMYWYERADISVAVAIEGGLVTPVVRGAEALGLSDISATMKDLAGKARDGKLMPEDYAGGTFSISNLGMFGIKEFSAVINPPQGAILAVGAGEMRAVVKDGDVKPALMMSCTMSCDHRAIDGAVGAEFLNVFKGLIEDPLMMLV